MLRILVDNFKTFKYHVLIIVKIGEVHAERLNSMQQRYSGQKLKEALDAQGRRYDWLAGQVDVSKSYVTMILNGHRPLRREIALKAANALQIPVHWLEEETVSNVRS